MSAIVEKPIRERYLRVALLVAREGLPAPETQSIHPRSVALEVATLDEALKWVHRLALIAAGAHDHPELPETHHKWTGEHDGGMWSVGCWLPTGQAVADSPLAEELAAAIEGAIS